MQIQETCTWGLPGCRVAGRFLFWPGSPGDQVRREVIWGAGPRRDAEAAAAGRSSCAGFALRCTAVTCHDHEHCSAQLKPAWSQARRLNAQTALPSESWPCTQMPFRRRHRRNLPWNRQDLLEEPRAPAASMAEAHLLSAILRAPLGSCFRL